MKFGLMLPAAVLAAFAPAGHAQESDAASAGATLLERTPALWVPVY